ncbi:ATP-binding cassette domain-containing protein [Streptomyces bohaiensis]|uniref:ATP-binding cassette domain-containing protein n=1 Tax=Streptomyces bohaiensis TaxID=1431344 RepID=UPI003B77FA3F
MDDGIGLRLTGVHKAYGRREVLRGATLEVPAGALVCVTAAADSPGRIGPQRTAPDPAGSRGAGRTTLARIAAGRLPADRGRVDRATAAGFCPQQAVLNELLTVDEHLRYFQATYRLRDTRRALELLDQLGAGHLRHEDAASLDPTARQKVNLTLALMHDPALLVLDDPCQELDRETRRRFWEVVCGLRDQGRSVLVVGRLAPEPGAFDSLRLADAVLELSDGRLTAVRRPAGVGAARG